mgnify:CR=1 FL=1
MKNLIFLFVLIFITFSLITSCGSDDDDAATTATAHKTLSDCTDDETVSGTIPGIWGLGVSGTYSMSWYGATPSGGCIDNSSALGSSGLNISTYDTSIQSLKNQVTITSNSSLTSTIKLYTDSACSNMVAFMSQSKSNITAGDNITISGPPSGYPGYGTKYTNTQSRFCIYGGTTGTNNLWKAMTSSSSWTLTEGELLDTAGGSGTLHGLFTTIDNVTGSTATWLYSPGWDASSALDNHSSSGDMYYSDNVSN